jgi:hypothetical protein
MTIIPKLSVESGLSKKGFEKDNTSHRVYRFVLNGKITSIRTMVSHSPQVKDIDDNTLNKIKRQLHLENKQQLIDFITCPFSKEDYINLLLNKGLINFPD